MATASFLEDAKMQALMAAETIFPPAILKSLASFGMLRSGSLGAPGGID